LASVSTSRLSPGLTLAGALALVAAAPAAAVVFHSQAEALALAFPDADRIDHQIFVLTEAQIAAVQRRAHAPLESKIVRFHRGWRGDTLLGWALVDIHTVRTLQEALMVVLSPEGRVRSLRVLAFGEPPEYMVTERWLEQFREKSLEDRLTLRGSIDGITGATLSARAGAGSVRRALALWDVLVGPVPTGAP
jgi:hypothetical protein